MADRPTEEALDWFTRLRDGHAGAAERAAFEAWRAADPGHAAAFRRVAALWDAPELAVALEAGAAPATTRPFARYAALAAAVLVCLLIFGAGPAIEWFAGADYRTARGTTETVTLGDGTVVRLNTATALSVDLQSDVRRVRLIEGEGYFDVARDPGRPFEVEAGAARVRVLGTAFAVQRADGHVVVAVRHGSVAVRPEAGAEGRLQAGEMVRVEAGGAARPVRFDPDTVFAWLDGRIVFRDRLLGEVLKQVGRYDAGWIVVAGAAPRAARVSGSFRLDDPAAIVDALARAAGAAVLRLPGGLTIVH